jgi:hypothetical protein
MPVIGGFLPVSTCSNRPIAAAVDRRLMAESKILVSLAPHVANAAHGIPAMLGPESLKRAQRRQVVQ